MIEVVVIETEVGWLKVTDETFSDEDVDRVDRMERGVVFDLDFVKVSAEVELWVIIEVEAERIELLKELVMVFLVTEHDEQ